MTYIPTIYTGRLANDAVTSAKILNGEITNVDVSASAAIAYSKLDLSNSIVSGDIVNGTIVDTDINAAAAIAYSKLALANSIVSADIVNGTVVAADTTISLAQLAAQTASAGDITASSQKITNLADGVNPNDAVNFSQLTAVTNGIVDWKSSVRAVTTIALPAYTRNVNVITANANGALPLIDGVTLVATDRLLLKNGAAGADNGIYEVTDAGGAGPFILTRTTDADTSAEVTSGLAVSVTEGTSYDNSIWMLSTNDTVTLNTTALTFIQLPSLTDLIAGAGLTKTGTTLDVGASTGIVVNANDVAIDTAVVPRMGVANVFTANNTFAGVNFATQALAGNYTVDLDLDHTLLVNSIGTAGVTITLPASHTIGDTVVIKDSAGGASVTDFILIDPADADTVDGAASYSIVSAFESIELRSNGTNWLIV